MNFKQLCSVIVLKYHPEFDTNHERTIRVGTITRGYSWTFLILRNEFLNKKMKYLKYTAGLYRISWTPLLMQFTTFPFKVRKLQFRNWLFCRPFFTGLLHKPVHSCTVGTSKLFSVSLQQLQKYPNLSVMRNEMFFGSMTLALENVAPISTPIPPPDNAIEHEDLTYVFEQSDYTDPEEDISDLKGVEPMFFHQASQESEPEVVEKIMEKVKWYIKYYLNLIRTQASLAIRIRIKMCTIKRQMTPIKYYFWITINQIIKPLYYESGNIYFFSATKQ